MSFKDVCRGESADPVGAEGAAARGPRGVRRSAVRLFGAFLLGTCAFGSQAVADAVLLTAPLTLGPGVTVIRSTGGTVDVPLEAAEITVQGTTLTINRSDSVTIASLRLVVGGGVPATLTHTAGNRVDLNITGPLFVDANSVINADVRGLTGSNGAGAGESAEGYNGGGAGYGGAGGDAYASSRAVFTATGQGGPCYGFDQASLFAPTSLGSGGGNAWASGVPNANTGGVGGGAIRLNVGGVFTLNGRIFARGGSGVYTSSGSAGRSGGGGSGGSVFITADSIVGAGSIVASGGGSQVTSFSHIGGGGGGGRIAIITNSPNLDKIGPLDVSGGVGAGRGGAGTIYTRLGGAARGTLSIDNNNASPGETTEFYGPLSLDCNVVIRNNGVLGPAVGQTDFNLTVLGDVEVAPNGYISADSRGRRGSSGLGQGQSADGYNGGGAGYGGAGGDAYASSQAASVTTGLGGVCHGFDQAGLFAPTSLGSGGGNAWAGGNVDINTGGFGGGAIRLTVDGTLVLNGQILARGGWGAYTSSGSAGRSGGGGSGGSVFITADSIAGAGSIIASGGGSQVTSFSHIGGGGGGGRIAIITNSPNLDKIGPLDVSGGLGAGRGGAGTIYTRLAGASRGTLSIDNNNASIGETTEFYGALTLDCDLVIRNNGVLGPAQGQADFNLTILGDVNVAANGYVSGDGRGRRGSSGPGQGQSADGLNGGGAGYGGVGGAGSNPGSQGGPVYGDSSLSSGLLLGSGGGNAWAGGSANINTGGFGGGAIRLIVGRTLMLNGQILARGAAGAYTTSGSAGRSGGGGSGGSVYIAADSIIGSGSIIASGGGSQVTSFSHIGGGGGGGRVVIVTCVPSSPIVNVAGGVVAGGHNGAPGTVVNRSFGVVQQPVDTIQCPAGAASLTFGVVGGDPLTYQWRKNSVPINALANPSAATATLRLAAVQPADSGVYDCVVNGSCGGVTSNPVTLSVCRSDFNCDHAVNSQDFFDFITSFFAQAPEADFNRDTFINSQDFFDFIAVFFAGC